MRVLLTGFEPFKGYIENSSWAVVKQVVGQGIEGVELYTKQFPVSFKRSAEELRIAVKNFSPDVIVMLGQSAASDKVRLERIAINMMDAKNPDNDGVLPDEEPISPNGRTALFTQLPIKKLFASIAAQGVPVVVSNSCGLYVCNRLYYEALNLCELAPQMKAIFVHVPLYKGQVDTQDGIGMNLHDIVTAVQVVITSVLQYFKNIKMDLLKALYNINSKSGCEGRIKAFVLHQLADVPLVIEEDEIGNLFLTKGSARKYPCVTAHLDEVHETSPFRIVEEASGIFGEDELGNMTGIGADDKNGLWIIIKLLHDVPVLKVALFVEEEKKGELAGCRGSKSCSLKHFENVLYVLAVDRKGCSEVVINGKGDVKLCDASFPPAHLLQQYEYECVDGGKTDVVELKMRGLSVPCCNISCGYYNAHKSDEYTNVLHLRKAYAFVRAWVEYTLETEKLG